MRSAWRNFANRAIVLWEQQGNRQSARSVYIGMSQTQRLDILQAFRGVAALSVVIHHATLSVNGFLPNAMPSYLGIIFNYGYLGVDFFFVLSGFIIMYIHYYDKNTFISAKEYLLKRIIRIYPPYLPISIAMILVYLTLPNISFGLGQEFSLASSLLLIPSLSPPALPVAWTLIHEVMFYIFFLLFFVNIKVLFFATLVWLIAIFGNSFGILSDENSPLLMVMLNPINIEFMLGMLAAYIYRAFPKARFNGLFLMLLGVILLPLVIAVGNEFNRYLFGISFFMLVLAAPTYKVKEICGFR